MIYDRQEFFDKYLEFGHDELVKYKPFSSIPSIIDMAFRDFIMNNFPDLSDERITKMKNNLFSSRICVITYTYNTKYTFLEYVYDLAIRIGYYRYNEEILADVVEDDNVVLIDDSWRGVVVLEPDDIKDIRRKVDECMNGI